MAKPGKYRKKTRTSLNKDSGKAEKGLLRNALFSSPVRIYGVIAVLLICFILNIVGINWSVAGPVSWQPDSIEGTVTAFEMQKMFSTWTHKYPRGQYIVNGLFYYPLMKHWKANPVQMRNAQGQSISVPFTLDRYAVLALISHWISACMSVMAVLLIIYIAYYLFDDYGAAVLSGLALSLCFLYVFFSHTGNVDLPSVFWFLAAMFFGIRMIQRSRLVDAVLLGFSASWLVCTKEGNATFLFGLGLAIWAMHIATMRQQSATWPKAVLSFWNRKIVLSIIAFFVIFLFLNGFLGGPDEFMGRMSTWKKVTEDFEKGYQGAWPLFSRACSSIYYGVGWPFVLLALIGMVYFSVSKKFIPLLFAVFPLFFYYLVTTVNIHFVVPRFLLCGYPGICLLVGKTAADWVGFRKVPRVVRYVPIAILYGLSLMYCIGLDMEMCSDTRERAEEWVHQNVPQNVVLAVSIRNNYAPRLQYQGYRVINDWVSSSIPEAYRDRDEAYPEYLIISDHWLLKPKTSDDAFRKRLFQDKERYSRVASFYPRTVYPAKTIWSIAGWGQTNHWISPPIYIYKKRPQ